MKPLYLLCVCLLTPSIGLAQLSDENLLQTLPDGYKIGFHTEKKGMVITELVPQSETVKNWTEMLTTQIFLGMKDTTPEQFQARMEKGWLAACKQGESAPVTKGKENGYSFSLWLQSCPSNPETGKPEIVWLKAIQGNDSFYVVQKAFRFDPPKEQVVQWMKYLRAITVCDTRSAQHPCPKLEKLQKPS
jgi:hypothetical protein